MKQIDKDRNSLKRLVESYGKKDVLNYVRHLNENTDDWWDDEDDFEKYEELEDIVRNLQASVTAAFRKQGINFEEFMTEDYDQDDDGYIWVSPDTLWNNGPVEDEFIRNNWMPRKDDIILAPALLINPETEDIIFLVGYEDEDSDQVTYKVQYTNPAQFANDFVTMYNYAKTHRNESYDSIIKTIMNRAVKI